MNDENNSNPTEPNAPRPITRHHLLSLALLVLLSLGSGFAGGWLGANSRNQPNTAATRQVVSNEGQLISQIAKTLGPSVVSVNATSQAVQRDVFGFGQLFQQESAGTGIIISSDGLIVTNRHVIPNGTTAVTITLSDGTQLSSVEVVGRTSPSDPLDIAFLRIKDKQGKDLVAAKLGDSSKVSVGDKVIAIGNALGQFQNTVTAGIISGYGRSVQAGDSTSTETLQDLFQTDTAINQGNSGGPLVNLSGEVIGINTAVAGGAENIGFAIPINDVQGLINSVLKTGKLLRPYLGVRYITLTDDVAFQLNLKIKRGAYIPPSTAGKPSILDNSPASKAGLQEKDIITEVNDINIDENQSLAAVLGRFAVGDKVKLTIIRDDKEQTIEVTLEAVPTS